MLAERTRPHLGTWLLPLLLLVLAAPACQEANSARDSSTYRVAVARFSHETCTFCPGEDPGIEDWTRQRPPLTGEELIEGGGSYVQGFVDRARDYGDIELIGLTSPAGVWGGSSRTWNQEEVFEHFVGQMLAELREAMPVDGVYLALHGAMAVRNIPRPEAEMARRFREVVGPDVPIVAAFDLHGNEDEEFLRWADGSFVTKRFPHYDSYRQGDRAARYIRSILRGDYVPTTATRKPPIITATVLQWTGQSPVMNIMERARRWEDREPGAYVSVFLGFPWSDVPDVGKTVQVMTNNNQALADEIADDMADFIWRVREFAHGDFPQPGEAARRTRDLIAARETPVVLGDYWDRPGDATWTLQALLEAGVDGILYASLTDEHALERIWDEGLEPGDPFDMEVGGYTGPQAGSRIRIQGSLRWKGRALGYDQVAAIDFGQNSVLVLAPAYQQTTSPEQLVFGGINPDDFDVFVIKSRAHFRRGFYETGYTTDNRIMLVEAPEPWFGTVFLDALDYENVPLDRLYPFGDPGDDWLGQGRLAP